MNNQQTPSAGQLPAYITSATPNPPDKRAPWYSNTAPTYAGIFLWFVFWDGAVNNASLGGGLAQGLGVALLGLVISALICHFLFYLVPGLLGQQTGLPLYIVGTSTFGASGGFLMPGFIMGLLQFGWLGVNVFFSSQLLASALNIPAPIIMVVWGVLAAFVGLKGIQYVAKVATYLPLIPIAALLIMFAKTAGGLGGFDPKELIEQIHFGVTAEAVPTAAPGAAMNVMGVLAFLITYVVGFFATAGAAGVDFGTASRDRRDVSMGGLVGIALAIFLTAGLSTCIIAGAYGTKDIKDKIVAGAKATVVKAVADAETAAKAKNVTLTDEQKEGIAIEASHGALLQTTSLMGMILGDKMKNVFMFLLALAAFPPACFSSFIAANSFKTTLPTVPPLISVGLGAAVSILLAISGKAGDAIGVFQIIGASFGPICGAMMVDYLISGQKWSGPRAGFNPAGWIAWLLGFMVGIAPTLGPKLFAAIHQDYLSNMCKAVPAAPLLAFIVGAVVYFVCAKVGLLSKIVPIPVKT